MISISDMANAVAVWENVQGGIPLKFINISMFLMTLFLAIAPMTRIRGSRLSSRRLFLLFLSLSFIANRLPMFCAGEQNPDESFLLSNAMLLLESPGSFLTMDMGTHGPLTSLPLAVACLVGFSPDYGLAKLCWSAIMLCTIILFYKCNVLINTETFSRLCTLLVASFFGSVVFWDILAFNGEVTVILEIMIAIFFIMRLRYEANRPPISTACWAGFFLGCVAITKIQGIPIGIVVAVYGIYSLKKRIAEEGHGCAKAISLFVLSGLIPLLAFLSVFIYQGRLSDFIIRYIRGQWTYATASSIGIIEKLSLFFKALVAIDTSGGNFFLSSLVATIFICIGLFPFLKINKKSDYSKFPAFEFLIFSLTMVAAAVYSITQPGNFFSHYYLFIYFPVLFLFASVVSLFTTRCKPLFALVLYALMCICSVLFWLSGKHLQKTYKFGYWQTYATTELLPPYSPDNALTRTIHSTIGDDRQNIFVWGWKDSIYVEAKLPRRIITNTAMIFSCKDNCKYYINQIINELNNDPPVVFIDAIVPTGIAYTDRAKHGYDLIPEIKDFVTNNYIFTVEINGVRIYRLCDGSLAPQN